MNKEIKKIIFSSLLLILVFVLPVHAQVNEMENLMINLVAPTPIIRADLIALIFKIIQYLLSFLGVVAIVILIYGGYLWMTARGDEEKVRKAKKVLINGLIGLIIILLSYAIVSFVGGRVKEIAQPGTVCTPGQCCGNCYRCNSDGTACSIWDNLCGTNCVPPGQAFVVSWTYPEDGDENISLCALIQAGFNAELDENYINSETIKITIRDGKDEGESCRENRECKSQKCENGICQGKTVAGTFTVKGKVFKFDNEVDFEKETWYRFLITTGVRSKDGRYLSAQRRVDFKTGSEEDVTPPQVEATYPEANQENVCLLDAIEVLFNEPMDATTLLDEQNSYTNPSHQFNRSVPNVRTLIASPINPYRAFTTYQATLRADLSDGIADVCGNKLDGNKNGISEGSPIDDYKWSFTTGNTLYCDPIIDSLNPNSGFYNDEITISGNYFKLSGQLFFNRDIQVDNLCFNSDNFPNRPCLISWQNNEIKVKVPAAGGSSEGTVSGPVYLQVGGRQSNTKNFTLLSPYISSFIPSSGGRGQAITIRGERFGTYLSGQSKVYFINEITHQRKEGNLICEEAGWKENEIVVAVPENIPLGNYYLQIKRSDGKYSNIRSQTFEVTNDIPGPILCDITPYCPGTNLRGGGKDDQKKLSGDRFGETGGKVLFDSSEAEITSWSNNEIEIKTPDLSPGTYQVKVQDINNKYSNPLSFVLPCLPKGGPGSACFLDPNTCSNERCLSPYECLSGGGNGLPLECRCCCTSSRGCLEPLECDQTQICYKNKLTGVEIYGLCCGCTNSNQCSANEICKQKGTGPYCCYACEIDDDGQACNGGVCCTIDTDNNGLPDTPICCAGRCVDHQCLSLCGNGRIDQNEECDPGDPNCSGLNQTDCQRREGCKWENSTCQSQEDLGGKTCQDLGYEGGTLSCRSDCKFDTSNCFGPPGSGYWGDTCRRSELNCPLGKKDCLNALGADCVKNIDAPCACCCRPDYPECQNITNQEDCEKDFRCQWKDGSCQSKGDSCKLINQKLVCDITQNCGESGQKGICCGCEKDEDCNNGQGFACKNNCCYQFPPPKELKVISATKDEISLSWKYEDKNQLATHFEIWKKDPNESEFSLLTTCEIKELNCDPNNKFILENPSANFYKFVDKRGNFEKGKEYSYKIRAKKGSQTAYSQFTDPVTGKVVGIISCEKNSDCPDTAPCCRIDTFVCVDWQHCDGHCTQDERCKPPPIKFASVDFWITTGEIGPCLKKVTPNQGYPCEPDFTQNIDKIELEGSRFETRGKDEGVFFNGKIGSQFEEIKEACQDCDNCKYTLWNNEKIKIQYTPPAQAQTGLVKIKKIKDGKTYWSNGLTFRVLKRTVGAGQACIKDIQGCKRGGGYCEREDIYPCIECDCSQYNNQEKCQDHFPYCQWNENNNSCENIICEKITDEKTCQNLSDYCQWKPWKKCITYKTHCRCCCDPSLRGPNDPCKNLNSSLECYPDQDPCTGENRGLCCGCRKDSDCNLTGNENGCDLGNPSDLGNPRCCRPRPILRGLSFCDESGPNNVPLNTGIILNFNQKMDFNTLNKENIKVSRDGNCESTDEGVTINQRCYLDGDIINLNKEDQTETTFLPKKCRLKKETIYKVEIVVGENGEGVRSEKGVSMDKPEGKCSWDETKNCQSKKFTTSKNRFCSVEWIDVQPRGPIIVRGINISVNYNGIARDSKNKAVCVESFDWQSKDIEGENVASVTTPGLSTIATSKSFGLAKIIAKLVNKSCEAEEDTCGLFKVSLAGPQVIEQQGCETCQLGGQSPSPWKNSDNACLKAQIVARFDKEINEKTLNNNTIKVRQCLTGDFNKPRCDEEGAEDISGKIRIFEDKKGFYFKPETLLLPEKIYRVTLLSGQNGIKDINGIQLDGNKNGIQDGFPTDNYVWYFKTSQTTDCPLNQVCVIPPQAKIYHPGNQIFEAQVYTANCNYLEPEDFDWDWSKVKIDPWDPDQVANLVATGSRATASSTGLGEVYIKASTQGKSDQARLTVATLPIVIDKYPTDKTECRNVAIWALFNQKMDEKSFAGRYKIEANNVDVTDDFSLRFITEKEKTKVYFVPKNNFLEKDTTYKITLFGSPKIFGSSGTSGIRSIAPFEREMVDDVSWSFKTGEYICRLEKVIIEPSSYLFIRAKERKDFLARAYYRDQEIQKVPDLYEWKWSWQSTDPTIVTITNSDNPSQTAESQAKNGQVNILATAEITVDNIFIPSTRGTQKTGSANVEVWLCENPWPCTSFPDCQPYQDIKTNFEFKYCRDAGRAGLDGDLPILGGPGEITGPAEPGLQKLNEHFFSVYDGSLSFLYDGAKKFSVINKSGYNNQYYNIFGNNNASISGNVAQAEGKFGQGFSFDGNSYLEVRASGVPFGRNLTIEPENFSLEAWIYPFKPGTFGSSPSPVSYSIFRKGWKDDLSSTGQGYALEIIDDIVYFWISDKEGNITKIKGGPIPRNSWTHLAATYDGKTLKLYINGILQSEEQSLKGGITHSEINLYIGENFRGLLDEIAFYHRVLSQQEIEKHLKDPISPTLGDVIGFKVFSNFEHLKPEEWYQKYAPGAGGSGSYSSVDGYRAIQVGRTVYVGATNVDLTEEKIYTNIYLVSQSDNPQPETSQIFRRSINNWKFNINVPDPDLTTPENENKGKLIRDLQRIWDLKTVWQTLESYQKINTQEPNLYPRLESGTYIKGMSTSKWPSWTPSTGLGQDLVKAGLSPLPVDPINKFALRDNCGQEPTRYSCCANCPFKDPNCSQTCYNPKELKYECYQSPDGKKNSHIYQYMVEGNPIGKAYSLYANFEFLNPDAWQHQCEELPETECQKRAFCYWKYSIPQTYLKNKFILATEPSLPGSCKRKILNYSGNPCSNLNMNCACFNTRFSSEIIEPPSPPRITLTANPTQIYPGQSTTLSWTTENAERCEASSSPSHPQWSGEISLSGSKSITLNQTTIFTLECSGPGGQSQAQVQVDVIQQLFTLNVSLTGTGSGTVTGSGINCRPDCSKTYNPGTSVTLTATPASGSVFAGWSGDCSGSNPTCQITMDRNKTVYATFNTQTYTLTVTKTGTGSGTVISNPAGINCGTNCSATYNSGTQVTLTADPASGSAFAGWSGDCSGTGSCTLTMNSNKSVTATFNLAINPPTVSTINATNITSNEAILNGLVNPNGSATTGWFRYHTTNPGTCNDNFGTRVPASGGISLGGGTSSVPYSQIVIKLSPNTTYYFCAIAENDGGKGYGNVLSFTTYPYYGFAYVANHNNHNVLKININNLSVTPISLPHGSDDDPRAICITPDKRYVFVTDDDYNDENIFKIDTYTDQIVGEISTCYSPDACIVTPDGQFLIVACAGASDAVIKYRITDSGLSYVCTWTQDNQGRKIADPKDIAVSPDGQYIYLSLGGSDMDLARIKVSDHSPNGVTLYDLDNVGFPYPDGIVLSRDGRYLYLSQSGSDKIGVWEIINNTINYRRTVYICDSPDRAIAITPDNQYLFIGCPGSSSDNVSRYTISGDNLIHSGSCGNVNDARYDLAVTPDNQYLIVLSSSDDKIYRYSLSYWNSCQRNEITQGVDSPRGVCIK